MYCADRYGVLYAIFDVNIEKPAPVSRDGPRKGQHHLSNRKAIIAWIGQVVKGIFE